MKKITKSLLSILCLLLLLTGCTSNNKTNNENHPNNNEVNDNDQEKNSNINESIEITPSKKGHVLDSSIGRFIIDKDGSVYYENYKTIDYMGMTYELTEKDLSVLGTKKQYINYTYLVNPDCNLDEGCQIEAYKLNLTNISSAYEVEYGNGGATIAIIFLTYDGKVHELVFKFSGEDRITLNTDISKHSNIVSVVKNMQFGGHDAILIDKDGNKYNIGEVTNANTQEKKGHVLNTVVGSFIIDKDGNVYYENYDTLTYMGVPCKITEQDLSVLGTKKQYINYTYLNNPECNLDEGCQIEAYKLDITNISSAYEVYFGNGALNVTILFVSYDGKAHELKFELGNNSSTIELTKDTSKYPNIVSVVPSSSFGGNVAKLIDVNGNTYEYYSQ